MQILKALLIKKKNKMLITISPKSGCGLFKQKALKINFNLAEHFVPVVRKNRTLFPTRLMVYAKWGTVLTVLKLPFVQPSLSKLTAARVNRSLLYQVLFLWNTLVFLVGFIVGTTISASGYLMTL